MNIKKNLGKFAAVAAISAVALGGVAPAASAAVNVGVSAAVVAPLTAAQTAAIKAVQTKLAADIKIEDAASAKKQADLRTAYNSAELSAVKSIAALRSAAEVAKKTSIDKANSAYYSDVKYANGLHDALLKRNDDLLAADKRMQAEFKAEEIAANKKKNANNKTAYNKELARILAQSVMDMKQSVTAHETRFKAIKAGLATDLAAATKAKSDSYTAANKKYSAEMERIKTLETSGKTTRSAKLTKDIAAVKAASATKVTALKKAADVKIAAIKAGK